MRTRRGFRLSAISNSSCASGARERRDAPFVAITGTNGKSTTTALIAHVLKEAGREVAMGGNIGVPVLDLPPPASGRTHVVECSSYQIDLAPSLSPSIGLLINITPDHLDRHGDLARYAAIKERLVANAEVALVGVDDEPCREIHARLKARAGMARVIAVSGTDSPLADVFVSQHRVMARGEAGPVGRSCRARARFAAPITGRTRRSPMPRRGRSASSATASRMRSRHFPALLIGWRRSAGLAGCCSSTIRKRPTPTPPKRRCSRSGISTGLSAGERRRAGSEPLRPLFPRVAKAYLIGEASDEFARTLAGAVPFERSGTLSAAIEAAADDAAQSSASEPAVLLSPACASFDQFANFEARGDAFRACVAKWLERRAQADARAQQGG